MSSVWDSITSTLNNNVGVTAVSVGIVMAVNLIFSIISCILVCMMRNGKESDRIHLRLKPTTQIYDEIPVPVKKNQVAHRAPNTHSSNNMVREISE